MQHFRICSPKKTEVTSYNHIKEKEVFYERDIESTGDKKELP